MNKDRRFRADKESRVLDEHVAPINTLVLAWRLEGRDVPWADPDLGGIRSRILFLHESPGPAAAAGHGSGFISPDNDDPTAARFWRLARQAGLDPGTYLNWNIVPWYVSATGRTANASPTDAQEALPRLHEFLSVLPGLRVVVVMGGFAEHWWLRFLRRPDSPVLPLVCAPHPSSSARRSRPGFEGDILTAMTKARAAAGTAHATWDGP